MIKESNFPNAYKEVYTILKYVNSEDLELIPKEFIDMLKSNMDDNYEFEFNPNIEFKNQKILRETKSIFAYIFLHYWGNEQQITAIKERFKHDFIKKEEYKKEKFPTDNIFEKTQKRYSSQVDNLQIVEYKRENILTKIINKIKACFFGNNIVK